MPELSLEQIMTRLPDEAAVEWDKRLPIILEKNPGFHFYKFWRFLDGKLSAIFNNQPSDEGYSEWYVDWDGETWSVSND